MLPNQWLSRISTEKDTKKIVVKKEEYYFYYQSNQKRGVRREKREGFTPIYPCRCSPPGCLLLASHLALLTPDKLISCPNLPLLGLSTAGGDRQCQKPL
jgi:hypothetical protein